jgi:dipeptidyl aminopeptidase/acylaminoacyl peptidase
MIHGCNHVDDVQLIPREVLCSRPHKFSPLLNREGDKIAYLARSGNRDEDTDLCVEDMSGNLIRKFSIKPCRNSSSFMWAYTGEHILIMQDTDGDENEHVICLDINSGTRLDLTPFAGAKSVPYALSEKYPQDVLVGTNKNNPSWFDVYKINIITGKAELVFNSVGYSHSIFDDNFNLRLVTKEMEDGSREVYEVRNGKHKLVKKIPIDDTKSTYPLYFGSDCKTLYWIESMGRDRSALVAYNTENWESSVLFESELADVGPILCNPKTYAPQYVKVEYLRPEIHVLDQSISGDINYLKDKFSEYNISVMCRNKRDDTWLVCCKNSSSSGRYYIYKRDPQSGKPVSLNLLFIRRPEIEKYHLQEKEPMVIKSRDGLDLVCYLTRSVDFAKTKSKKMVVYAHGGPHARDSYCCEADVQLLSNRGYSVLQVNYRGSAGFGKKFANAANGNLDKVRNDILDCVNWAIENGIADKDKVAIMGASFGGYLTLCGLAFTPDVFCCGVDVVGISNIRTLLSTVPPYWKPYAVGIYKLYGNPNTEEGRRYIAENSPLTRASSIKKPLLVLQGKNDPRVKKDEADQIVNAVKKHGLPVAYVLYPDEGHGFCKEPNHRSSTAFIEAFLAKTLGGRLEPIQQSDVKGSSHQVLEGEDIAANVCE